MSVQTPSEIRAIDKRRKNVEEKVIQDGARIATSSGIDAKLATSEKILAIQSGASKSETPAPLFLLHRTHSPSPSVDVLVSPQITVSYVSKYSIVHRPIEILSPLSETLEIRKKLQSNVATQVQMVATRTEKAGRLRNGP